MIKKISGYVNKYRGVPFEERTLFSCKLSIFLNSALAVGKFLLSFFFGIFFLVAAIVNVCIVIAKLECYLGVKYPNKKSFQFRNNMIGVFLLLAGAQYAIYMARLIFTDVDIMNYDMVLGISIACVSFVEMAIAIKGCFSSFGKGHYYRNIKLVSLCSAMTAIVLTEVALTSFASETDTRLMDGLFGVIVGILIILVAIFIFIAPRVSILDREHNVYKLKQGFEKIEEETIKIKLTNSKFYGDYIYKASVKDDLIEGHIVKGKSPIFKWNIYLKIFVIVLSEILIFVYAFGALVFYFKSAKIIRRLDEIMLEKGYEKIIEDEQEEATC